MNYLPLIKIIKPIAYRLFIAFSIIVLFATSQASAMTLNDFGCVTDGGTCHYDPNACVNAEAAADTQAAPTTNSANIFLLGDSILVGAYYDTDNLKKDLVNNKWKPYADASGGRGMAFGGNDTRNNRPGARVSGLRAIDVPENEAAIKEAGRVVIELGTNAYPDSTALFKTQMNDMIDKILAKNPNLQASDIYWVNIFSKGEVSQWASAYNGVIQDVSDKRSIHIIHTVGKGISLQADNIHPDTAGWKTFSNIVSDAVGSPPAAENSASQPIASAAGLTTSGSLDRDVGASEFIDTGGYRGDQLTGTYSFAELSPAGTSTSEVTQQTATNLGKLDYKQRVAITYKGKTVVAEKLDIGKGGGAIAGKRRDIDLIFNKTAKALGVTDPHNWSGVVHVQTVSNNTPLGPASASSGSTPTQPRLTVPTSFTLKDKIGQLLFVGVSSNGTAASLAKKYNVGGFLLNSGSTYNKAAIDTVKSAGTLPALIAVDEEGGQVDRLNFNTPSAKELGKLPDSKVKEIAEDMGKKMAAMGIDIDFAPVADLDNGKNAAISKVDRAFSSDPDVVASKAGAFGDGLSQAGIVPTYKHFPGLGNATGTTGGNTDTGPATTPSLSELKANDLKPYKEILKSGQSSMVMMGNQKVPGLTSGDPATMSKAAYDLLKDDYGFGGVIVTDEIGHAGAVPLSASQAVIKALKSGADMPLFNADNEGQVGSIIDAVAAAVNAGSLENTQIDASLSKVLTLKNGGKTKIVTDPAAANAKCCPVDSDNAVSLQGSDHEEQAYNFFVSAPRSLTPFQAATIVGVLEGESGVKLNTSADNPSTHAYGIAQWLGGRKTGVQAYLSGNKSKDIFQAQLEYVWQELQGSWKGSLTKLKTETDINTAVYNFEATYEVSGHGNMGPRYAGARRLLHKHAGDSGDITSNLTQLSAVAAVTAATCEEATAGGADSGSIAGYKNPYRALKQKEPLRIDMGLDYAGKGPIYAIGSGTVDVVYKIGGDSGWPGPNKRAGGWVSYTLSEGPAKGRTVYMAENCEPTVKHGDPVTADTKICDLDGVDYAYSEMGWANDKTSSSAAAHVEWRGHDSYDYYTAYGENFSQLIEKLGDKPGTKKAGSQKIGTLPHGWPTW